MKNSKQKGKRYELHIAHRFIDEGYEARRTAQFCGNTGDAADVEGVPYLHIECKHQEKMHLWDWIEQAIRDCNAHNTKTGASDIPIVIHTKNYADDLVTMRFEDFIKLYREYEVNNEA